MDVHDYAKQIEMAKKKVLTYREGQLACSFLDHLTAIGLSRGRVATYGIKLRTIVKMTDGFGLSLKAVTRLDAERVMSAINAGGYQSHSSTVQYKPTTKAALAITFKKLVQYAQFGRTDRDQPYPEAVSWIKARVKDDDTRVTPEKVLKEEEFLSLVNHAKNKRDKALFYVLYEAAFRPGELLTMKVSNVEFNDKYCVVTARGKTGLKRVPLVVSMLPLLDWINEHPSKDDPEAPLWPTFSRRDAGKPLSYQSLLDLTKDLANRAGFRRDLWPYLFRHSRLTFYADKLTEARLDQLAGWRLGSPMPRRYVHWSGRDLDDSVLDIYGMSEKKVKESIMKPKVCPRCVAQLSPEVKRCTKCGLVVDQVLAAKYEERNGKHEQDLIKRIEKLEKEYAAVQARDGRHGEPSSPHQGTSWAQ